MSAIPPNTEIWSAFRTRELLPELPELHGKAFIDRNVGKYHTDAQSEIRANLHEVEYQEVIQALRKSGARISCFFLTVNFLPMFWRDPPKDCVGALLQPDGHVACAVYRQVVPLTEPLYIFGRPKAGSEHSRDKPHLLDAGGIPIVSDELFAALRQLGAEGETGDVIYRGAKKADYGTVQPGFRRFLPRPEYEMRHARGFEFMPAAVPSDFGVVAMLRSPKDCPEDRWYEIAAAHRPREELRRSGRHTLFTPIFRLGGSTHRWMAELERAVEELRG